MRIRRSIATVVSAALGYVRRLCARALADRQIILRTDGRVRCVTFGRGHQLVLGTAVLGLIGWTAYVTVSHVESERVIAARDHEIGALELAYRNLRSEVARSETRFRATARALEARHAYLMALMDRNRAVARDPAGPPPETVRERIEVSRQAMLAQLGELELVLGGAGHHESDAARRGLGMEARLDLSAGERARLERERRRLTLRIEKLERRLAALDASQRGVMERMAERTMDRIDRIRTLLAGTGLDVDTLLGRLGDGGEAQGGPFIAAGSDYPGPGPSAAGLSALDVHMSRWQDLRRLLAVLPLTAPSDHYYVASAFGKRRDPINRRWSMHYGLDLAGVSRSPVLATAPGTVVSAGWNGNFGRMVEIDHGMGIRTRYGHLRKILVQRGQQVGFRDRIGLMGSTGRSTGPHIHYEVLVNGKPYDPMKFLQAGKHVLEGP